MVLRFECKKAICRTGGYTCGTTARMITEGGGGWEGILCWPCVNILGLNYWSGWENTETTAFKAWESCYDTGYNHCPDFGTFAGFFLSESRSMKKVDLDHESD